MDTTWVQTMLDLVTAYALNVIGGVLLLIGGWVVSKWVHRGAARSLDRTRLDPTLARFFANAARWLVLIFAVLASLELFGVQTTSFIAVLGAAGLAVGLAFQGTLSNFAAGVLLLIFRPFRVGDAVRIAGQTGKVEEIDLFMTKLDTFDNRRLMIPNSKITGDVIETITFHPIRRADVAVGTEYAADLDRVRSVLERAAASVEGALDDPPPQVVLTGLGASSIDWEVRLWAPTSDFLAVRQAALRAVKQALDEAGIGIPFPQMDVHLDPADTRPATRPPGPAGEKT
ncbi:mechanosensitive ion channel [Rhodocaloribacter litoris]|uniref:mechanosensitive ion channel family protein n=1 Tax=Rhodocaloribacter litoris TaxID=2558931 RepID=UPI00142322C4|nr:mechanosensitive ion channel domain-containing protein [Rhodocaloribacter litoris]QXD14366.1 mechanosensitive ion channel [Rhodocaloribacter litoris]